MLAEFLRKQLLMEETFPFSLIRGSLELLTELPRASGVSRVFREAPLPSCVLTGATSAAWRCLVSGRHSQVPPLQVDISACTVPVLFLSLSSKMDNLSHGDEGQASHTKELRGWPAM